MWYDATVAAGLLEADDSPVKGRNGYALSPHQGDGRLRLAVGLGPRHPRERARQGHGLGVRQLGDRSGVPQSAGETCRAAGRPCPRARVRRSYENPNYQASCSCLRPDDHLEAMQAAPIDDPGTTPRPGLPGVQYVGVPEFQDVGTRCTEQFSAAIAGNVSVDDALAACQAIASEVAGESW